MLILKRKVMKSYFNSNNVLLGTLFMVAILFNIVIVKSLNSKFIIQKNYIYKKIISDSILLNSLQSRMILLSNCTSFEISSNIELLNEHNEVVKLSNIINGDKILIYRFNEFSCAPCVYEQIAEFQNCRATLPVSIIFIASYKNSRDLYINKRVNSIDVPIYNLPLGSFKNELENFNLPYVFVLDKCFNVSSLFIPDKNLPSLTKKYIENLNNIILSNNMK